MIERRVGAIEPGSIWVVLQNYPHSVKYSPTHRRPREQIYAQALVDGKEDQDFSAIAATAEKLSGVKFKKKGCEWVGFHLIG